MRLNVFILLMLAAFLVGGVFGVSAYKLFFCADVNKAIVKQLEIDKKKGRQIEIKHKKRLQENEKIKTIIKTVKDTTGCNRVPSPELRDILLDSLSNPRCKAGSTC